MTGACWFDEWNGDGGFPESAWVAGTATVGLRRYAFAARLTSNGWPELTHLFQLDVAAFYLDRNRKGLSEKDELFTASGELHHADDTSLVPWTVADPGMTNPDAPRAADGARAGSEGP